MIGIFRNVIWDVIVYPSSYFAEKGTVRKDPVEIIVLRSNLADRPMKTWVPVTDEGSGLCDSKVSHYAMIGSTEDNSYLGGATVTFHSSDSNSKLELVVFVDI